MVVFAHSQNDRASRSFLATALQLSCNSFGLSTITVQFDASRLILRKSLNFYANQT